MSTTAARLVVLTAATLLLATHAAAGTPAEARIRSGTWHGIKWELRGGAWRDGSYCTATLVRDKEVGRACGKVTKHDSIGYSAAVGRPEPDYVTGAVLTNARSVHIEFFDRAAITVPTIRAPRVLQGGVRFFMKLLPCPATPRKLVARDANGAIVARFVVTHHMEAVC
jgi:hypothetical protein